MRKLSFVVFLAILVVVAGCAKEKSETVAEKIAEKPETLPAVAEEPPKIFSSRSSYAIDYSLKVSGPQSVEGGVSVAAKNFKDNRFMNIATTTRIQLPGQELLSAMYFIDNKGYTCSKQAAWECVELPLPQVTAAHSAPGSQEEFEKNIEKAKQIGQRTIAGEQTKCYESIFEPVAGTTINTEYCYTSDGIPLLIKTIAGEVISEMTATSFSRSVSDDAFNLPAEPRTL